MNLSEYSSEVVSFDPTWDSNEQVHVRDVATETNHYQKEEISHKSVGTLETKEIGIQVAPYVISNSNEETDKKLALWLRKIMPALEKELSEGVTQVYENPNKSINNSFVQVTEYQKIDVKTHFAKNCEDLLNGIGVWLSILIQNNPSIVVSTSLKNRFNEPSSSFLILLEPQRSNSDGNIYWQETFTIPIKPIDYLIVNSENRDMFAGASSSGDLFIWTYAKTSSSTSNEPRIIELFSKTTEDSILAITFLNEDTLLCCHSDGSIVSYKILNRYNCIIDKVMKIDQRRLKDSSITAITSISSSEFVIGLLNGKIFQCSMNQFTSQENTLMDPITRELSSHKFAVKSLKHCEHSGKNFIISFDASSEIFIHEIDDDPNEKSLKYAIRLPLPIKNSIALTASIEYIFCPLSNGSLEVFSSKSNSRRTIEGHNFSGTNILCELSKNESWLLTGIFNGTFNIYHICIDQNH